MNSTLDNVNELLRLGYGDTYRLENIKQRLANGKVLYASDNDYLQKVVSQYRGEIQKVGEHKKREPTPEPKHVPTPEPKSEPTTSKNKSVGNKKNIFIVIGVLAILVVIGGAVVMSGGFEKTVSTSVEDEQLTKETTSTATPISQCGVGTIFDEELNICVLKVIPTHPKCGQGVLFDEDNRKCIAP